MKKNILIVDDDTSVRKSLCKVLRVAGYNVMEAADGSQAVEWFETGRVDLLLLDIGLPVKSGWDIFERITSQAPVFPIIIVTGKANQFDMAVAAGVGALMEKPLDAAQLLKTIQQLLAESKEARLRRLCGYSRDLRYLPSENIRFQHRFHQ
jgi:DNA-binding response OmpR family regulator